MILLTPGPCMTSDSVRAAGGMRDMNHREPAFRELMAEVRAHLGWLSEGHLAYLLGGSGTAAAEAMMTSCVGDGKTLIVTNGYYSERLCDIATAHGMDHEHLRFAWRDPIDLDAVDAALKSGQFEALAVAHQETTTGRLNPVDAIAAICDKYGVTLLLDAISSLGAEAIPFESVPAVCCASNKCLHGLPGVSFVMVRADLAERMKSIEPRSYYLHLPRYTGESPPLTPPVPALAALRQALRELDHDGGWEARHATYAKRSAFLRSSLVHRGYRFAIPIEDSSSSVTTVSLPPGKSFDGWFGENYAEGFVIYGCKGELSEGWFQVAVMGDLTDAVLQRWLDIVPSGR